MSNIVNYRYNLNSGKTYSYQKEIASSASSASSASCVGSASSVGSASLTSSCSYETVIVGNSGSTGATGSVTIGSVGNLEFNQLVDNFTRGNLVVSELIAGLKAKGAKSISSTQRSNLHTVTFKLGTKTYKICCNTAAAASQIDTKTSAIYTKTALQNTYGLTDTDIANYFIAAKTENNVVTDYALKPDSNFKTAAELSNYLKYQKDLTLDNFLNDVNKKENTVAKLTSYTQDGDLVTYANYKNYAEEIYLATGDEATKLRQEALNKLVMDFTSGNLANEQVKTILNAIGINKVTYTTSNNLYTYSFEYEGKSYTISCNKEAAAKGSDEVVTTVSSDNFNSIFTDTLKEQLASELKDKSKGFSNEETLAIINDLVNSFKTSVEFYEQNNLKAATIKEFFDSYNSTLKTYNKLEYKNMLNTSETDYSSNIEQLNILVNKIKSSSLEIIFDNTKKHYTKLLRSNLVG